MSSTRKKPVPLNIMVCPICRNKVEDFDEPDESTRAVCHKCKITITIRILEE